MDLGATTTSRGDRVSKAVTLNGLEYLIWLRHGMLVPMMMEFLVYDNREGKGQGPEGLSSLKVAASGGATSGAGIR